MNDPEWNGTVTKRKRSYQVPILEVHVCSV